ncbi:MAG: L-seryl-tRNA(Sec) selenium transferase [Spirochaetales bacterium]|nr:L-seryl-tRNA(Sec) selenium transferase [Spirochaetales bacterium]
MNQQTLNTIPQIEVLLETPEVQHYSDCLGRPVVADIVRSTVEKIRNSALNDRSAVPPFTWIVEQVMLTCRDAVKGRLQQVVNATGVIIHTNMGRAPILRDVWEEAKRINCGYSNLELDTATGKRGKRKGLIPLLVSKLVESEDALIVNNNAAAVFLILSAFAKGREVIVNRGEQVQIGGGFRIPEILAQSGACLVEIGTTNISTDKDYLSAFTERTAMILSVHRSNFTIRGFTSSPSIRELAEMKPKDVLLCVDQGSGVINEKLPGEITVRSHIHNGADLVCFSGDKMLGGPQAGIIAGKKELIKVLEQHPLMRVFRPGKTVYSLLESTLIRKINGIDTAVSNALSVTVKDLKNKGRKILKGIDRNKAGLVESTFTTGGGSLPDESFPSLSVIINNDEQPEKILGMLREAFPPIIGTISSGKVHLNLATIHNDEIPHVRRQLQQLLGG